MANCPYIESVNTLNGKILAVCIGCTIHDLLNPAVEENEIHHQVMDGYNFYAFKDSYTESAFKQEIDNFLKYKIQHPTGLATRIITRPYKKL